MSMADLIILIILEVIVRVGGYSEVCPRTH